MLRHVPSPCEKDCAAAYSSLSNIVTKDERAFAMLCSPLSGSIDMIKVIGTIAKTLCLCTSQCATKFLNNKLEKKSDIKPKDENKITSFC